MKTNSVTDGFNNDFDQIFKEELTYILLKLLQNISVNSHRTIVLIPKPNKDITRKQSYLPDIFCDYNAKILSKMLRNKIWEHI